MADSALNGTQNLCKLLEEGLGFSVAKSALSFSRKIRENELDLTTFSKIKDDAGLDTPVLYKIIPFENICYGLKEKDEKGKSKKYKIECNLMITFSESRQKRDLAVLEENINRAKLAIERKEKINSAKGGWKQIILTTLPDSETDKAGEEKTESKSEADAESNTAISTEIPSETEKKSVPVTSDSLSSHDGDSLAEKTEELMQVQSSGIGSSDAANNMEGTVTAISPVSDSSELKTPSCSIPETDEAKEKDTSKAKKEKQKSANVSIASALNETLIQKRKACAGYAGILYHEPPGTTDKFKASYVSSLYHHLVQIEECFRVMKNDFEIRPVYLRERQSITGHILLCVLSLIMLRLIQKKYKDKGKSIMAEKLRSLLSEMKLMAFCLDDQRCVYHRSEEIKRRNCLRSNKRTKEKALFRKSIDTTENRYISQCIYIFELKK